MELLQLKYFLDAAKSESFSKVAKKYGVPTSDISQTIKRLERELGAQLFDRSANRIALSEQGRAFLEGARAALDSLQRAKARVQDCTDGVLGEIQLLALCNRRAVTEVIEKFHALYPQVNFVLSHSGEPENCDIIISDTEPGGKGYKKQALINERVLLAVKKDGELENVKSVQELKNARFVTMPRHSSQHRITEKLCEKSGFSPNISIFCDDPFYVRKYVEIGLGATFVPEFSWAGQFSDKIKLLDICDFKRTTYLFISGFSAEKKAVKLFVPMLKQNFDTYSADK